MKNVESIRGELLKLIAEKIMDIVKESCHE